MIGFFGFTAMCVYFSRRYDFAKHVFIAVLIIGLMIPTMTGAMLPPFARWSFFPYPAPQNTTQYSVVLVNESGEIIDYPKEAAPPGRVNTRGKLMITEYNATQRKQMAMFLLQRAQKYRLAVADGLGPLELIRFGHLNTEGILGNELWTPADARRIGYLHGIKIYKTRLNTSDDGRRIINRSQILVYEYLNNS